jgi:hypothetical protein
MTLIFNIPQHPLHAATILKARLITLGLHAISRGQTQMVQAITHLIQERRWSHV